MTYADAGRYLLSLHNIYRREYLKNPEDGVWYLKRTQWLLNLLGNPEKTIPHYIHVAGTSGKGSVSLMLGSILRAAGQRVGTMTSPGLAGDISRTEINGEVMAKREFTSAVARIKKALRKYQKESPYDAPSIFEILTALSWLHFVEKKVDWAIMEVGLGGRYDSTNVIPRKDIAIITNIGLDHTELLGDTKEKIAYEKAGIIKRGCLVFTSEKNKKVLAVIKRECRKYGAPLKISNLPHGEMGLNSPVGQFSKLAFAYQGVRYALPVFGRHQINNALLCIDIAHSLGVDKASIQRGLASVKLPLRLEVVSRQPLIILDGAHNPDKMKTTINAIQSEKLARPARLKINSQAVHLIVGFSADKNISAMVKQLAVLKPATVACTQFTRNIFRVAANPSDLARQFKKFLPNARIKIFFDPQAAFGWSKKLSRSWPLKTTAKSGQKSSGLLLVTGSFYLAGELRTKIKK